MASRPQMTLEPEAPLAVDVTVAPARTAIIRMTEPSGSVLLHLTPDVSSVPALIQRFHEHAFSSPYASYATKAVLLRIQASPKDGAAYESHLEDLSTLTDGEVLLYKPCPELRHLLDQGCITPILSSTRPTMSPSNSPSLKRKGRASSVTSNAERVHRYDALLAKIPLSTQEKELVESLLLIGDEQIVDAMEQYSVSMEVADVKRALRRQKTPLEHLSHDFQSLEMHSNDNPFISAEPMETKDTGDSTTAGRPSLSMRRTSSTSSSGPPLQSIQETSGRGALSLDGLDTSFDTATPSFFSLKQLLDQVPVQEDFYARYQVGNVLGAGKFSVVKACTRLSDNYELAVKVVDKAKVMELRFLKRELEILHSLRHDGIVQLVEVLEDAYQLYIVLEKCHKELFEVIDKEGPLDEQVAKKIVRNLLITVAYLHKQLIVHRDVKPENILLFGDDVSEIKLTDFGIARRLDGAGNNWTLTPHEGLSNNGHDPNLSFQAVRNRVARAHTKCGSRDYVAPEVMSGKGYGMEADLYSVGVVTYVLLSGCAPVFVPDQDGSRRLFFAEDLWARVSDDGKAFIQALLVHDPEERLAAADALEHAWLA